jgi:hypothetical protein
MADRDRDESGRPRNTRPRDALGRPLRQGSQGVPRIPDDLELTPAETLAYAQHLLDRGLAFNAHEVLEAAWKNGPADERPLWQSLAQLLVGITPVQRGNVAAPSPCSARSDRPRRRRPARRRRRRRRSGRLRGRVDRRSRAGAEITPSRLRPLRPGDAVGFAASATSDLGHAPWVAKVAPIQHDSRFGFIVSLCLRWIAESVLHDGARLLAAAIPTRSPGPTGPPVGPVSPPAAAVAPQAVAGPCLPLPRRVRRPGGLGTRSIKWMVATERETIRNPVFWDRPENMGQYRDDRQHVFLDGKSNLVIRATRNRTASTSRQIEGHLVGRHQHHLGGADQVRLPDPRLLARVVVVQRPSVVGGEVDMAEWYGNANWPSGTTVHAREDGTSFATQPYPVDSAWHTWRVTWNDSGMYFWQDYVPGAEPYFTVPANSIDDWPFNLPDYRVFPVLNLAVAGSGGGDPAGGTYPADMLVDYVRVW